MQPGNASGQLGESAAPFMGSLSPTLAMPAGGGLVVPSNVRFALMRTEAKAAGRLTDLRQLAAAWEEVAKKCDLAFEELFRLAVFRLEVERDLGVHLAQTVSHGRPKKKYPRGTVSESGLPDGVTKKQSAAYQQLAGIPEDEFRRYIENSRQARRTPSSRGARAFTVASKPRRSTRPKGAPASDVVVSPKLLDACVRCLGDIDVLVGKAKVKAAACFADLADLTKTTVGSMLVVGSPDPARILRRVAEMRETGLIAEAIVALPRDVDAGWWSTLSAGPWSLCVPSEHGAAILAHIGGHAHAFSLVCAPLGVVVDVKVRHGVDSRG